MNYKRIPKLVPFCEECQHEIMGNGSIITPYYCHCGKYVWDNAKKDYVIEKD